MSRWCCYTTKCLGRPWTSRGCTGRILPSRLRKHARPIRCLIVRFAPSRHPSHPSHMSRSSVYVWGKQARLTPELIAVTAFGLIMQCQKQIVAKLNSPCDGHKLHAVLGCSHQLCSDFAATGVKRCTAAKAKFTIRWSPDMCCRRMLSPNLFGRRSYGHQTIASCTAAVERSVIKQMSSHIQFDSCSPSTHEQMQKTNS